MRREWTRCWALPCWKEDRSVRQEPCARKDRNATRKPLRRDVHGEAGTRSKRFRATAGQDGIGLTIHAMDAGSASVGMSTYDLTSEAVGFISMPTVKRLDGYRVVIYPNDHLPEHIHLIGGSSEAIITLGCPSGPPFIRRSFGFEPRELRRLVERLWGDIAELCRAWKRIHDRDRYH